MPRLRAGFVNFINTLPLFAALESGAVGCDAELITGTPAELNYALAQGQLDVALISGVEFLRNRTKYTMIPGYGIAAHHQVISVCLYIRDTIASLDGQRIGLTKQSASSSELVKVMCHHYWNISCQFETIDCPEEGANYEGFVLIGDQCLLNREYPGYTTIDLAQAWYHATGLPFTFAVFAARKEILEQKGDEMIEFQHCLKKSLAWATAHRSVIEELAAQRCPIPANVIKRYYQILRHDLGEQEMAGFEKFEQLRQMVSCV